MELPVIKLHGFVLVSLLSLQFLYSLYCIFLQGQDGIDLEMNRNGTKSRSEFDDFVDVVCCFFYFCVSNKSNR